jgi:hypothetical protein
MKQISCLHLSRATALVAFCLRLLFSGLQTFATASTYEELKATGTGKAIKGSSATCYIMKDGIKYPVKDKETFQLLGYNFEDIALLSDITLDSLPTGSTVEQEHPPIGIPPPPQCPCKSKSSHNLSSQENLDYQTSLVHLICIVHNAEIERILSQVSDYTLNIKYISEGTVDAFLHHSNVSASPFPDSIRDCNVIINIVPASKELVENMERRCPGKCLPIPYAEIPLEWLLPPYNTDIPLSCSMSMSSILSQHGFQMNAQNTTESANNLALLLHSVARRRSEECLEKGLWPMGSFFKNGLGNYSSTWTNRTYLLPARSNMEKRKVYGLIIWVGSNDRLDLVLQQTHMLGLQKATQNDSQKIFGWVATEDVYPCNMSVPNCEHAYGYHWMMPSGVMRTQGHNGWGCAQRRPLRSLAHTLLLFDPDFVFVGDDDTYIRVNHLSYGSIMTSIIMNELSKSKIVMGQLNGGNKVTKGGFFYGGSGYLMGRATIDVLNSFSLLGPSGPDSIRHEKHMNHLGLFEEARDTSSASCTDCLRLKGEPSVHGSGQKADLLIRLVDLCTNILSDEGTCYHSDHALSRCFVHAAYVDVWNVACQGKTVSLHPPFTTGMCMGVDNCTDNLLTCHRWWPNMSTPDLSPMPYKSGRKRRRFLNSQ